jgi:hypothetical protein
MQAGIVGEAATARQAITWLQPAALDAVGDRAGHLQKHRQRAVAIDLEAKRPIASHREIIR